MRARLVARAEDWAWSSVRVHLSGVDDELAVVRPVLDRVEEFAALLAEGGEAGYAGLRASEGSGRPVGNAAFIADLERLLGRPITRRPPGENPLPRTADTWAGGYRCGVDVIRDMLSERRNREYCCNVCSAWSVRNGQRFT